MKYGVARIAAGEHFNKVYVDDHLSLACLLCPIMNAFTIEGAQVSYTNNRSGERSNLSHYFRMRSMMVAHVFAQHKEELK